MTGTDEISRRLAAGESFEQIILATMPANARHALRRCALAAGFDEDTYKAVLRGSGGPPLADLQRSRSVEPRPGCAGEFRVSSMLQAAAWSLWWSEAGLTPGSADVPPEFAAFGRRFAEYCRTAGRQLEALRALVVGDQDAAAELLAEQYEQADEEHDLARCHDLLAVLSEPHLAAVVGPQLAVLRNDLSRYLNARSMWHGALLASSRYLTRPDIEMHVTGLLEPGDPRALRLDASGGMGKTTTLQWFIARHCVPRRIACALVDLDAVDPVNATRHPWLVLLEIAAQLDVQLDGAPFQELLHEHGSYRSVLLAQPPETVRSGADALGGLTVDVDADDVLARFLDALRGEDPDSAPVLVVVDTVEEAMLRPAGDPEALLGVLRRLLDAAPQARLVISGRRTAAEARLTGLPALFPRSVLAELKIPLFSEDEAARYLTDVRGVRGAELVDAVMRRAAGQPWMLALCADYVLHTPGIQPADVQELDPALAWCIDRVIGRVGSDALQWLVRYAVVLRRLRRDVAESVLLPRIAEAMRGSDVDRPENDARPKGSTSVFRTGIAPPAGPQAFDELWQELLSYAATSSWVRTQPGDIVVLHPSVVEPLRRLLAEQRVHRLLHADAVRYYERRGAAWSEWQREVIYHRFQLDGPAAGDAWRAALARAHDAGDVGAVLELASEVLGPEYLDEDRRPREHASGQPVLDAGIQARANLERAWALATAARRDDLAGGHPAWSQVELNLDEVDRLTRDGPEPADGLPRARWALTQAALLIARHRPADAVALLGPFLDLGETTVDTCAALMVCADAQRAQGHQKLAEELLLRAHRLAGELGDASTAARIARTLAGYAEERGRYDKATNWTRMSASGQDGSPTLARLAVATGQPSTAARLATDSAAERAAALRTLGWPTEAAEVCRLALEREPRPDDAARLRVEAGLAAADLLDLDPALWHLVQARESYFARQDLDAAARCSAEAARIYLRQVGNLAQAEQYLNEGLRLTLEVGSTGWTRLHLGMAELQHHLGHADRATEECRQVLDILQAAGGHPALQVSAALHGLTFGAADGPLLRGVLHRSLSMISPAGARLAALADLTIHPGPLDLGEPLAVLPPADTDETADALDECDAAWRTLRLAEVHRVAGLAARAVENLTRGTNVLADREATAWWPWLRAMERIGPATVGEVVPPPLPDTAPPLLAAAYEVTLARRRVALDGPEVTEERVQRARGLLSGMTRITRWHALLEDVAGRLAAAADDTGEQQRKRDAARAVYRQLGDELAAAEPAPEDDLAGRELTVQIELDGERLAVQAGGDLTESMGDGVALAAAIHEQDRSAAKSPLVRHLLEPLRDTGLLAPLMHIDGHLPADGDLPVEVRLTLDPPLLAQVPWELVPTDRGALAIDPRVGVVYRVPNEVRAVGVQAMALQRALQRTGFSPGPVDGLVGTVTRDAVRAFQRSAGLTDDGLAGRTTWAAVLARLAVLGTSQQPRVLILRREADDELRIQRGSNVGGHDLESLYRKASWGVRVVTGSYLAELDHLIARAAAMSQTDVLHVSATMDVTQTVPHLSFGTGEPIVGKSAARPQALAVTALDRMVQQLSAAGAVPLVVLDIAAPPRDSELLRQLLARNDFAHQMVALGHVETVLATAGSPARLVELLTGGRTAAQIAGELQSAALRTSSLGELLTRAGTALVSSVRPAAMAAMAALPRA